MGNWTLVLKVVFPVRAFDRSATPDKVAIFAETIGGWQRLDARAEIKIPGVENGC